MNTADERHTSSGRRSQRAARLAFAGAAAAYTLAAVPAATAATKPADRRATGAYLHASYEFDRAVVANQASADASVAEYVKRLSGECPDVLANAPSFKIDARHLDPAQSKQLEQEGTLTFEVVVGLIKAWISPSSAAFETFSHAVSPLRWSSPRIARLVRSELSEFKANLTPPPLDACADMRAWVASGYRVLPPGARAALTLAKGGGKDSGPSLETVLARMVVPAQKPLARRRKHALNLVSRQLDHALSRVEGLLATLGVRKSSSIAGEPAGGAVIARGTTAAGTTYTISSTGPSKECQVNLTLSESSNGNKTVLGECLSRSARTGEADIGCTEGNMTIHTPLPPGVRTVALKLADGRKIVSPAISIAADDGGPLGFYYQALPNSSARPTSLIELDAHGRRVGAIAIADRPRCPVPKPGESTSSGSIGVTHGR